MEPPSADAGVRASEIAALMTADETICKELLDDYLRAATRGLVE
jgi:hypothetical protein